MYAGHLLPEWDCSTCTPLQKDWRGCTSDAQGRTEFNGELLKRCPRRPWLDDPEHFSHLFWLYGNYKRGILPEGSALYSNPNVLLQCFQIIENAAGEAEADLAEIAARKAARG